MEEKITEQEKYVRELMKGKTEQEIQGALLNLSEFIKRLYELYLKMKSAGDID